MGVEYMKREPYARKTSNVVGSLAYQQLGRANLGRSQAAATTSLSVNGVSFIRTTGASTTGTFWTKLPAPKQTGLIKEIYVDCASTVDVKVITAAAAGSSLAGFIKSGTGGSTAQVLLFATGGVGRAKLVAASTTTWQLLQQSTGCTLVGSTV